MSQESKTTTKPSARERNALKDRIKSLISQGTPLTAIPHYCAISEALSRKLYSEIVLEHSDEMITWVKPCYEVIKAGAKLKAIAMFKIAKEATFVKLENSDDVVNITPWGNSESAGGSAKVTKLKDHERDDVKNAVLLHLLEGVPLSAIPELCKISYDFAHTLYSEIVQENIDEIASWPKPTYEIIRAGSKLKDIRMLDIEDDVSFLKIERTVGGFLITPFGSDNFDHTNL